MTIHDIPMLRGFPITVIRTFSIIIFLIFFGICGSSQTLTFNKKYVLYDSLRDERFFQVIPTQHGFLVAGLSYHSSSQDFNRLVFMVIDSAGNVLSRRTYGDSTRNYWLPENRTIISTPDSMYIMALSYQSLSEVPTILMKLNSWGDTLWTKKVGYGYYYGIYPHDLIRTLDGGYVIGGLDYNQGCLLKLDSNYQLEWYKLFGATGAYYYSDLWSVHELPGSGYVIGYTTNFHSSFQVFMCRLDTAGNTVWSRPVSGYYQNDIVKVDLISDSTILGVATRPAPGYNPNRKNIEIKTWDVNGNQKDVNYPGPITKIYFHHLEKLNDSTYVASGRISEIEKGWWMIINTKGESILYKEFSDNNESKGFYCSVGTTDGGILSVGENKINGRTDYDPWILKTDIYGCLTPGCDPEGIYIISQPISKEICTEDTATFCILANDDTSTTISRFNRIWQQKAGENWIPMENNSHFQGVSTDTLQMINAHGTEGTYYLRCLVWNDKYYLASKTVTLSVRENTRITKQPVNQYINITDAATFMVKAEGEEPISYQWYFNENEITGETKNVYRRYPVGYSDQYLPFNCRIVNPCDDLFSESAYIVINSTGTDSLSNQKSIRVYTVPYKNVICIEVPADPSSKIFCTIFDLTGHVVRIDQSESKKTCIDVHGLNRGLYILKISCNHNDSYKKIILE